MPFWKRPVLPEHPEGELSVPEGAGPVARDAIAAFNAGDFSRCRTLVRGLRATTPDGPDAEAARDLLARLRPDPVLVGLAALSVLVLVFLALWSVTISH
jgi:hypothetical protein